jgi:hypothetical protein
MGLANRPIQPFMVKKLSDVMNEGSAECSLAQHDCGYLQY